VWSSKNFLFFMSLIQFFLISSKFYAIDFKFLGKRNFFNLFPFISIAESRVFSHLTIILNIIFLWNTAEIPASYMFTTTVLLILGFCSLFHCSFLTFIILSSFPNFPFETSCGRCFDKVSGSRLWHLSTASRRHIHMHTRQTPLCRKSRCYKSTNPG